MSGNEIPALRIGVGLTTVGRWDELALLLEDLATQTHPPHAVAIAHHGDGDNPPALDALVGRFAGAFEIRTLASPRGVSNGRNAAAQVLADVDWLWFPNDTSRVDPDFLARVAPHCAPPRTVLALQLADREGPRNPLPERGSPMTRRNVWGVIEPATVFRREQFDAVGGFDTDRGSGATSPWQAGEGTDLLLRMSERDDFSIEWISDIVVRAQTEFAHLPAEERRRKLRNYGRGAGNVLRTWRYPLWYKLAHLLAAILQPLRNPDKYTPRDALALFIGRTEGLLGRPFSKGTDHQAIVR